MTNRIYAIAAPAVLALALVILSGIAEAAAAPKAKLWPYWDAHAPASQSTIDHAVWDELVHRYVKPSADGINRFDYGAVSPADHAQLGRYISALEKTDARKYSRAQQFAYWVNLYNAVTVRLILTRYPVGSITQIDISPGFFAFGPWDKKLLTAAGQELSLNDIEHRILRPIWGDPRIHYALNCASLGCPNLATRAYTEATMEAMLERAARDYVNHPRGARMTDGKLRVSKIYTWYKQDFGNEDAAVIAHLQKYAAPPLAAMLKDMSRISGSDYNWALNDATQ